MEYKDYSAFVMEHSGSISYICDIQNYEILYMSKAYMKMCGLESTEDYKNKKCYKILQGFDEPCSFCSHDKAAGSGEYSWEYYNEKLKRRFDITDSLIPMDGRPCRVAIARDVSAYREEIADDEEISVEDMLFRGLNTLTRERNMDVAVNSFLHAVGSFYQANRAYIIEFDLARQTTHNTFEWCAPGVSAEIDNLQDIPLSVMDRWLRRFQEEGDFSIDSLDKDLDPAAEDYQILQAQGIESLLAAPLWHNEEIVGFIGVDNPHRNREDMMLLRAVSGFVLEELEKRRLISELEQLSLVDMLTGLKNRRQFGQTLQEFEWRSPGSLGVIALDINGLKEINNVHGYQYGDQVIRRTAELLQEIFPEELYRIGGDEFAALCIDVPKDEFRDKVVALRHKFDQDKTCDVSIGFAWNFDVDSVDANALLRQADEMRHAEKQSYYQTVLSEGRSVARTGFAGEVLQEIQEGRFIVYYQPQVELKTGRITGAEALVRKRAKDGGTILPGKFLSFYEMGGVISHIDLFVFRTACAALRHWHDLGYDLQISVNFSRVTLLKPHIAEEIVTICGVHRIEPSAIMIEVTESIGKMDNEQLKGLIQQFKAAGFRISLDDFGSQYSNLAILAAMDFDEVKFDRSLVSSLEKNEKSCVVMKNSIDLCHGLQGTSSLAEGIETEGQLELLTGYRCDYGQGYYFSRPVPLEQFDAFLSSIQTSEMK